MENQRTKDKTFEKFTWTIENFSKLDSKKLYSETFFLSGHPWRIIIFPRWTSLHYFYLSVYLDAGDVAYLPKGWSRYASFKLSLTNQDNAEKTIVKKNKHVFDARHSSSGFRKFIPLYELCDSSNGFIVSDTCIIEAETISVRKLEHECEAYDAVNNIDISPVSTPLICVKPIEHTDNPLTKEISVASFGDDFVDFMGLGKIEKAFVTLLEEVCSWHPSLVGCQQKRNRTRRFTEWAFTSLGRVLHFLKTKKVKDMNDDACNHLQILWEELETFNFDLTWLEPHFQSALGMKGYLERAVKVKKLKENVDTLELDLKIKTRSYIEVAALLKKMKETVDSAEMDLKKATRNLVEAQKGFVERDLDAELGYRGP